jgi:hypothetical protein
MKASCLAFTLIRVASAPQTASITGSRAHPPMMYAGIQDMPATGDVDGYTATTLSKTSQASITERVEIWQYCNSKRFASEPSRIQVAPGQPIHRITQKAI